MSKPNTDTTCPTLSDTIKPNSKRSHSGHDRDDFFIKVSLPLADIPGIVVGRLAGLGRVGGGQEVYVS